MKKILALIIVLSLALSSLSFISAEEKDITVIVNGTKIKSDVPAQIVEGRTLLPVRAIFEAFGMYVSWDADTKTVTGKGFDSAITMKIGDNKLKLYGVKNFTEASSFTEFSADVPAQIIDGRTMVPVRALAEALNSEVLWNGEDRTVTIEKKITSDKDADGFYSIDGNSVRIIGRYYKRGLYLFSSHSASGIEIRFKGTEAKLNVTAECRKADEPAYIHVFVDGKEILNQDPKDDNRTALNQGANTITLCENLPDGVHTVKILKANEERVNKIRWDGFYTDGELLGPPPARERLIQVHGDSITVGYNNMAFPDNDDKKDYGSLYQDSLMTYATYLGRFFDADMEIFAQSGYSVYNSIGEGVIMYDRASITNPAYSSWDHNIAHPDLIILFSWVNDYGRYNKGQVSMEQMEGNFYSLTYHFLNTHPEAKVLLISSRFRPDFTEMLKRIKENYAKVGDASRILVYETQWIYQGHPKPAEHEELARELEPIIAEYMGW